MAPIIGHSMILKVDPLQAPLDVRPEIKGIFVSNDDLNCNMELNTLQPLHKTVVTVVTVVTVMTKKTFSPKKPFSPGNYFFLLKTSSHKKAHDLLTQIIARIAKRCPENITWLSNVSNCTFQKY